MVMLREPEASLVRDYLEHGGEIRHVPFGISGKVYGFRELSAVYGMRGWVQRFGVRHVPHASVPFILAGQLSVPAARAELIWDMIRANQGRATISALAKALGLSRACIEAALNILERAGAVMPVANATPARFVVSGSSPHWPEFVRTEERAA